MDEMFKSRNLRHAVNSKYKTVKGIPYSMMDKSQRHSRQHLEKSILFPQNYRLNYKIISHEKT